MILYTASYCFPHLDSWLRLVGKNRFRSPELQIPQGALAFNMIIMLKYVLEKYVGYHKLQML